MDDTSRCASTLPWIWVIEALASFKEVNVSILHDLIEMAPEVPDDLGKNMMEMLALRCLEGLFGTSNGITNSVPYTLDSKVEFDLSKSCEDVLQQILHETSLSDLKMSGPELLKWDVQPFILHKRSSMPKLALEQLKDSILEGSHPYVDSLKKMSGLAFKNNGDRIPANGGNCNARTLRANGSCSDARHMGAKGNSMSTMLENGNKLLEKNPCNRNLLPSKRDRTGLATENMVGHLQENQNSLNDCDDLHINAKKQKQCASSSIKSAEENAVPLHGRELLEESSEGVMPVTEREGADLAKDQIGTLQDGHDEYTASKRCEQSCDDEFHHNQSEIPYSAPMMPQDTSRDEPSQNISVDEVKDDSEHQAEQRPSSGALSPYSATVMLQDTSGDEPCQNISSNEDKDDNELCAEPSTSGGPLLDKTQQNESQHNCEHDIQLKAPNAASLDGSPQNIIAHEAKEDMDRCCEAETSSDSDGYDNERIDVSRKKHEFLSSQCTFTHDSIASAGWTDQNLCMKCNEGGQLLVCSTSNCPLVVHENCLGSSPGFDNNGNFYCPFCACSIATSEYLEAKKKASLARKELAKFVRSGLDYQPKELNERLHRKKPNLSRQSGVEDLLVKNNENGHLEGREGDQADHNGEYVNEVNNLQFHRSIDDKQQAEPSASRGNVNSPLREEETTVITEELNVLTKEKEGEEKVIQECVTVRALEGQNQKPADHEYDVDNLSCRDTNVSPVNHRNAEGGVCQEISEEPVCALDIDAVETSEDENDKSIISHYTIRFRKRETHYTYPASPQLRRKKVPWTAEEEEILKEGLQKFSFANDRNIPWKKILDFGGDVFLKGRTTIDLKDKWRNMCKGSPKSK